MMSMVRLSQKDFSIYINCLFIILSSHFDPSISCSLSFKFAIDEILITGLRVGIAVAKPLRYIDRHSPRAKSSNDNVVEVKIKTATY